MKLLIIGGVAGGASCATRARRLSETAQIVLFERGPFVSFSNCGLPYYVGDVIQKEEALLVAGPARFREQFNIEVRLENEVLAIDRAASAIEVKEISTGKIYRETYDALVLAPGAAPIRPPLPGLDAPGVFVLRTIPDSRKIKEWIAANKAKNAVIVGGGFIGMEMAENLAHLGLKVSILEMQTQVLPPFDPEMVGAVHRHLKAKGVELFLGDALAGIEKGPGGRLAVATKAGRKIPADLALLSLGVRPESKLAGECGLPLGARGGIRVDEHMRTADAKIWAVGDAAEVRDYVTGEAVLVPLAGPANRQGRIAADNIFGKPAVFRGVQGTAVCKIFDMVAALTGAGEKTLRRLNIPYEKAYLHAASHAAYYPGAKPFDLKLLFSPRDGRVLGAQAVGEEGVEKRIDVIAMAIQKKATVYDLEESELCYAPQFGSAKDPVNVAGMIAANALRGEAPLAHWDRVDVEKEFLLDVRSEKEYAQDHVEGAIHIPLDKLRASVPQLPAHRDIFVYCGVGQRAYNAVRLLRMRGLKAFNLSGGIAMYHADKAGRI